MSFGNARAVVSFLGSSESSEIPTDKWFQASGKVQVANGSGSPGVTVGIYDVVAIYKNSSSRIYRCTSYDASSAYGSVSTVDISFPSQYGGIEYI